MATCRACLCSGSDLMDIHKSGCDVLYKECTSLQIEDKDDLPHGICVSCYNILNQFYFFKQLCNHSDITLHKKHKKNVRCIENKSNWNKPVSGVEYNIKKVKENIKHDKNEAYNSSTSGVDNIDNKQNNFKSMTKDNNYDIDNPKVEKEQLISKNVDRMKQQFYKIIAKKHNKANNSYLINTEKYRKLIKEVNEAKRRKLSGNKRHNRDYWLLHHYDVVNVNGKEHLIAPVLNQQVINYIPFEEVFDVLYDIHKSISHAGRDRMKREVQKHYKNITIQQIQIFLNVCEICAEKRRRKISSRLKSGCKVDLIDYQLRADGDYKFIMVYQDYLTKFIILKPLKNNEVEEVAQHVLDIFLLIGAPSVMQSEIGPDFCNSIIAYLQKMWSDLKIIFDKPQSDKLSNNEENIKQIVEDMLNVWMENNQCTNWSKGLGFVQFKKNRMLHAKLNRSPYEAMFSLPAKVGFMLSGFNGNIKNINTDDLNKVLDGEDLDGLNEETLMEDLIEENGSSNNKCATCEIPLLSYEYNLCTPCLKKITVNQTLEDNYALVNKQPVMQGLYYSKCYCRNRCINNLCSCKRKKVTCGPKCHSKTMCCNR